jgi:hypothetical protein
MLRLDCHTRLKQVKGSYDTALQTVNVLMGIVRSDPTILYANDLKMADIQALAIELHKVYFTRLFACFESSLRLYWQTIRPGRRPSTEQLLSSIARRHGVPQDTLDTANEIRNFRNYLIHEENEPEPKTFTIDEAMSPLNTYIARLPNEW